MGVGIVAIATVVVTVGASAHPANSQTIKAGGTLNVGWENNFADMSDSFDPTGEYLGDAWGILSGLMVRNLVSYKHVAGAGRQRDRPGHRHVGAEADERRQDLHVPPQAEHQVQPARQPRGHLG